MNNATKMSSRDATVLLRLRSQMAALGARYSWGAMYKAESQIERGELRAADDTLGEAETRAPTVEAERAVGRIRDRLAKVRAGG